MPVLEVAHYLSLVHTILIVAAAVLLQTAQKHPFCPATFLKISVQIPDFRFKIPVKQAHITESLELADYYADCCLFVNARSRVWELHYVKPKTPALVVQLVRCACFSSDIYRQVEEVALPAVFIGLSQR